MQLSATPHAAIATLFPSPTLFNPKEWYHEHREGDEEEAKFLHYFSTKTAARVAVQVVDTEEGKRYTMMEVR